MAWATIVHTEQDGSHRNREADQELKGAETTPSIPRTIRPRLPPKQSRFTCYESVFSRVESDLWTG